MLKMIGAVLEIISDFDLYLCVEKGMKGGISYIANGYSKASNKSWNRIMIISQVKILHIWEQTQCI